LIANPLFTVFKIFDGMHSKEKILKSMDSQLFPKDTFMKRYLFALTVTALLVGCGANNDGNQATAALKGPGMAKQSSTAVTITGIIRNEK